MSNPTNPLCVVIGANGFIGSAVVAASRARGWTTVAVTRQNYDQHRGTECDLLVNANGNSKKFLANENPPLDFDLSVRSVHGYLHDFKPAAFVHLSTIDVYSDVQTPVGNREDSVIERDKLTPYGFHKLMAEDLVRYYAKSWLILRMGGFVGPGLRKNSIYDMLNNAPLRVHPDSAYQYLDSRVLAGFALDLHAGGFRNEIVNCAGDGLVTIREIAAMIPACQLPDPPTGKRERYEVNIEKLKSRASVPATRETVARFISETLAAKNSET